jgi:acyl-CoA synthetase (AMP-forming)/AMP-acid ligase II
MHPGKRIPGTVGQATGVEIAIMDMAATGKLQKTGDIGEIVIKGENVMHGYNNNPEANAEAFVDGWFRTGDQGFLDAEGYLSLTGRIKELINRGGEKISPLEIDGILLKHPAVAEAVCFAVPDEKYGEVVHAAVVLKGDADQENIRTYCREQMADFKVPDVVYIADSLPRTATGKIQRRHMVAAFAEGK